jgi:hypothetical protein
MRLHSPQAGNARFSGAATRTPILYRHRTPTSVDEAALVGLKTTQRVY